MAKVTSGLPSGGTGTSTHNNLSGLNDGDYKHLTAVEKAYFDTIPSEIDAKVEDQIVNGVTDIAPSQNAVYDALLLKANDNEVIHTTGNEVKTGTLTTDGFIKSGGTSSQFLKADGSVDNNIYENTTNKGIANGYAGLDGAGKVPISQLPNSVMEYKGIYNALTNTPILIDGIGNTGDVYRVSVAGSGVNNLDFVIGDYAVYNGSTWEKAHSGADNVTSVFGRLGTIIAQNGDYTTALVPETTDKNYQTDTQKLYNDATSSIQTQLNTKANDISVIHNTGNESKSGTLTTTGFIKAGGLASQFLKADGSVDSSIYENTINKVNVISGSSSTEYPTENAVVNYVGESSERRVSISDTNHTITGTDNQLIAYTSITADRTVSLPAATKINQRIWITDESGLCSNARRIIVAPNGSDVIGGDSFSVINFPNGSGYLESNGSGKWNIISTTAVQFSAGINTAPTITDNGDGTITIGTGVYSLYANIDGVGRPKAYQIPGGVFTLVDNNSNFIYAEYNTTTSTVSLQQSTDESLINDLTRTIVVAAYRQGLTSHIRGFDRWGIALNNKINRSIYKTQRVRFEEGGTLLSETATPAVRTIAISSGTVWIAAAEQFLTAVTSAANTCYFVYHIAGVWQTNVTTTQYNNTQYDDGTNLQTVTNNRYVVNWVYRSIGTDNDIAIVLGGGDYTLGQAQISAKPINLPLFLRHMELIGRIIVKKNDNTATQIDMVSSSIFTQAGITDHNSLNNLQLAQAGVTWGHINDTTQTIAGDKTFSGNITGNSFIKSGGTSTQFLKADGSVDSTSYAPSSGSTSYIQNQNAGAQVANMWISGSGRFGDGIVLLKDTGSEIISVNSTLASYQPLTFLSSSFNFNVGAATFVSTVTAPTFIGNLTGNANSANRNILNYYGGSIDINTLPSLIGDNEISYDYSVLNTNGPAPNRGFTITNRVLSNLWTQIFIGTEPGVSDNQEWTRTNHFGTVSNWVKRWDTGNLPNPIAGTLNSGYMPKATGANSLGNSLVYDNGTNIGIGTTEPTARLHVLNDAGLQAKFIGSSQGAIDLKLVDTSVSGTRLFSDANNFGIYDFASSSTHFVIKKTNGNVGIGTTNPLSRLNATNTYYVGTPTKANSAAFFDNQGTGVYIGGNEYTYSYLQAEQSDNTTVKPMALNPLGGNVLIGTTSDNGVDRLQVTGNITASPATSSNHVVIKNQLDLKADLASPALTGTPTAPTATVGTNTTQLATTAFVLENARPYKVYTALLSQSGTNAPVAVVLENTLGANITWSRTGTGLYTGTLSAGTFASGKNFRSISKEFSDGSCNIAGNSPTTVQINSVLTNGSFSDGKMIETAVEIRVYP